MKILKIVSGTISFLTSIVLLYDSIDNVFLYYRTDEGFMHRPIISDLIIGFLTSCIFSFYLVFTKFWKNDFVVSSFRVKKIIGFLYSIIIFLGIILNLKSIILSSYGYVIIIISSPHIIYLFMSEFWKIPKTKEND